MGTIFLAFFLVFFQFEILASTGDIQRNALLLEIENLQGALRKTVIDESAARGALEKIEKRLEDEEKTTIVTRHISADPMIASLREKIISREAALIGLMTRFGPRHPEVVQVEVEIRSLKERLMDAESEAQLEVGRELGVNPVFQALLLKKLDMELDLAVQGSRKAALIQQIELLEDEIAKLPQKDETLSHRSIKTNQIGTAERALEDGSNKEHIGKNMGLMGEYSHIFLGILIIGASMLILVYYLRRKSFILLDRGLSLLVRPSIETGVSKISNAQKTGNTLQVISNIAIEFPLLPLRENPDALMDPALILAYEPSSLSADAIRLMRLRVERLKGLSPDLMVISPVEGGGATTIAINLATALALNGSKICLIDANFHNPSIHKCFNLENDDGLTELIQDKADLDKVVKSTDIENLSVITVGFMPHDASDLLMSLGFNRLIERMKGGFDYIIFDSSPLIDFPEGALMATLITSIILVKPFSLNQDSEEKTKSILDSMDIKPIGQIVNQGK